MQTFDDDFDKLVWEQDNGLSYCRTRTTVKSPEGTHVLYAWGDGRWAVASASACDFSAKGTTRPVLVLAQRRAHDVWMGMTGLIQAHTVMRHHDWCNADLRRMADDLDKQQSEIRDDEQDANPRRLLLNRMSVFLREAYSHAIELSILTAPTIGPSQAAEASACGKPYDYCMPSEPASNEGVWARSKHDDPRWVCRCPGFNLHQEMVVSCALCNTRRPAPPMNVAVYGSPAGDAMGSWHCMCGDRNRPSLRSVVVDQCPMCRAMRPDLRRPPL